MLESHWIQIYVYVYIHTYMSSSSVHGIFQARILEWAAISFLPNPGIEPVSPASLLHCRQMLYQWATTKPDFMLKFCQKNALVIANTFFQQYKRRLNTRTSLKSDWLYSLHLKVEKLYTVNKNKTGSWLWLRSWTPYCRLRLKLKKVGKTTRPFRYDLSQIPYDYTVEVTDRFNGLDLIDGVPEELWIEVCDIVQEAVIKTIPKKKKGKMVVWQSFTNSWVKRSKRQRRKGKIYPCECRVPKNSKER